MPVPTNIGKTVNRFNTGPDASIGPHVPVLMTNVGSVSTTKDGDVIAAKNCSGKINVLHNNCTIINSHTPQIDIQNGKMGTRIEWCDVGATNGLDTSQWGTTEVKGGDYLLYRSRLYGSVDHTRPNWGNTKVIENWFGPPFSDPNGHTGGARAHCDPFQPHNPPSGTTYGSLLIQGNKFDIFPFNQGQSYLAELNRIQGGNLKGDIGGWPATCGSLNAEYRSTKNVTMRDNYWDGNYFQFLMNQGHNDGAPQNIVFIDNIIVKRRPNYGASGQSGGSGGAFVNLGAGGSITWGRNLDAETGATIACQYKGSPNGTVRPAGPSSEYATYYTDGRQPLTGGSGGGGEEEPEVDPTVAISSPADGSVHTSGTVTFMGDAEAPTLRSAFNNFEFWIANVDRNVYPETLLDVDSATGTVNGTNITATVDGPRFNNRQGVPQTPPAGQYELILRGKRGTGMFDVVDTITVTFGDTNPPPVITPQVAFQIQVNIDANVNVNTTTGGVPPNVVRGRMIEKLIRTWDVEFYRIDSNSLVRWDGSKWVEI